MKKLFALSGNRCAFPDCDKILVDEHDNIFAQICHIEAAEPGGVRYNPNQTDEERRSFDNLILLCANHHIESNNVKIWTVEKLKNIKYDHEKLFLKNEFRISDKVANKALYFDLLENVETELDRENTIYANKVLEDVKNIISDINDENMSLEYEILRSKCMKKLEKIDEAKQKFLEIAKRFPCDSRALLYLAEIYLNDKDYSKNLELLQKAENIDKDFWLLRIERLIRKNHLKEKINLDCINESSFHDQPKIKSSFFCLYALFFEDENKQDNADCFIEKAIHANPEKFSIYIIKLTILEKRLFSDQPMQEKHKKAKAFLDEIIIVENKFLEYGDIGARNKAILNVKKINALRELENFPEIKRISEETIKLSLKCFFNKQIEQIITAILSVFPLPDDDLNLLLEYIKESNRFISDELSKVLIIQFNIRNNLLSMGKTFFSEIKQTKYIDLINDIESNNFEHILVFLMDDILFAEIFINTLKYLPALRIMLIENLPNIEDIQKNKLLLLYYANEQSFDKVFCILKNINLSDLSYFECKAILPIIQNNNSWDFEVTILQIIIEKETDEKERFKLQIQLFSALYNLKQFVEVIKLGKDLLEKESTKNLLDNKNKEILLSNTIFACFERGKIENNFYEEAEVILIKHSLINPSYEFQVGVEAEVYLHKNDPQKALNAVIEGVKTKKLFSPQEYAQLYFLLAIKIGTIIDLQLSSLDKIGDNTFVKLKNQNQWYFIGEECELDAIKISKSNDKYPIFENKKVEEIIIFDNILGTKIKEDSIEFIFPIERYVLWQAMHNMHELAEGGDLEGAWIIDIPQNGETIDTSNIIKFFNIIHKETDTFFEKYVKDNLPLALLALSEGGILNAIGRIENKRKGFVNFCSGTIEDFARQKEIANKIILENTPFYIDGTSALFLSESGYLKTIFKYVQNMKVPLSVINFLSNIIDKLNYTPGQAGSLKIVEGKLNFHSIDEEDKNNSELVKNNIKNSILLFESNNNNIKVISPANKVDCLSENKISPELCDACIMAQNSNLPILTEDYLYLKMNYLETNKKEPAHLSSLALIRVLYEDGKINFDDYIKFFGYLSSYRFRFLPISLDDIFKVIFGYGDIKIVKPENIRKLNLPLTLSEEYGISLQSAYIFISSFLLKILIDNSIPEDTTENIFLEIVKSFPNNVKQKDLSQILLGICFREIEKNKSNKLLIPDLLIVNNKISKLLKTTEIFQNT